MSSRNKQRPNPDPRSEYPLHLHQSKNWIGSSHDNECCYYPCKTYDKAGNLLRIESRAPFDLGNRAGRLRTFDMLFAGHSGPDDSGG